MPDIYGKGIHADDLATARRLYDELDYEKTIQDMGWIAKKLRTWQPGSGVGAIGFSSGGAMALEACAASEDIFNAVSFYGLPSKESWEDLVWALLKSGKPVQIQYGAKDQIADFKDAQAFRDLLKLNGNVHQFFDYGLQGHAFLSSESYRKQLAQPITSNAGATQQLSMMRAAHFLLHHTPRFNLDAVPDLESYRNPYELAPNDPLKVSEWKRY